MKENNIEEDVKYVKEMLEIARVFFKAVKAETDYKNVDEIAFCNALENILAEREQKDKRIKELEQALLKVKDKNTTLFITCRNSIPKQVVIDELKRLSDMLNRTTEGRIQKYTVNEIIIRSNALQELLEGEK